MDTVLKRPGLLTSTGTTYCCSVIESRSRETKLLGDTIPPLKCETIEEDLESNYFKSTQWVPDGTSLLTSSCDNTIRTFILPPDLLSPTSLLSTLTPYTTHLHPTSINCLASYPAFNLSDPSSTLYLSTPTALPIRLSNALSPISVPISTYNLISLTTEAYYTPSSLLWSHQSPGTFLAGTDCLIALFDVSRNGEGPVTRMPTIPSKRHKMKGGGVGMRGLISALSAQPGAGETSMLAAGTWTRWVGLYDASGMGGTVAQWSVAEAADKHAGIRGMGISQTMWSSCGRYLYVVERKSKGALVYDVRGAGKMLCWLEGRSAETNQRLGVDCFEAEGGMEIWAGGMDGVVRVWENVGMTEGACERSWEWKAHDDPVTSTVVHSSGTVVATCSGQRSTPELTSSDTSSDGGSERGDSDESDTSEGGTSNQGDLDEKIGGETSLRASLSPKAMSNISDNSIKVWRL
ncbi:hypothetical protein BGZ60DRAFT_428486 [Tricladium varicosporioides]|nr:hypothetical protein BGZ60DRAFT_428486 [Hymenoscyphus varicosporioides]